MMCVSSTRSTFSMVKNGKVSTPSLSGLLRLLVGIRDLHQVDIGDLAHRLAGIGVGQLDLVDALELGEVGEAVLAALALRAGLVGGAFAIVALDDQAARARRSC